MASPVPIKYIKSNYQKNKKKNMLHYIDSVRECIREISVAMVLQIQTDIYTFEWQKDLQLYNYICISVWISYKVPVLQLLTLPTQEAYN